MAPSGSLPQAIATPRVVVAWMSCSCATGSQARATRMASLASRCASVKAPSSILSWARPATTVARSGVVSRGTSSTARRAACIAPSGSPAARRMCASRSCRRPTRTRSRRASRAPIAASRYAVARDARPTAKAASAARTWRSGLADERSARRRAAVEPTVRSGMASARLEGGEFVGRSVARGGDRGRIDRRCAGQDRVVGAGP